MAIVWYVSSHGFGHAARDVEVINEIGRRRPDVRIVVRRGVPASFVEQSATVPVELQHAETDTGVVQIDSLHIDEAATARQAAVFHEEFSARADAEAEWLRRLPATLVVGAVPALACAAAERAGVPSIVLGNFVGLDRCGLPGLGDGGAGVIGQSAPRRATCALRLPLHGGFETMRDVVRDVPFIARRSYRGRDETRRALGLSVADTVVLASFGGHNLGLDYGAIARGNPFRLLLTDYEYPRDADTDSLVRVTRRHLGELGLKYEDLIAAADAVVGKPGYGIVSECVANGVAFLYALRSRFVEQDVFEREMPALVRCRRIEQQDLIAGRWQGPIEALLAQPPAPTMPPTNGAEEAGTAILDLM
jgi:L-arabinokinase